MSVVDTDSRVARFMSSSTVFDVDDPSFAPDTPDKSWLRWDGKAEQLGINREVRKL